MNWRVQFGTRTQVVIAIVHGMCEYRTCTLILLPICSSSSALQSRSRNLIRALQVEILSRAGISSDLRQKQGPGQMFVVLPMPAFSMFVVLGRKNVRSELRCCPCRKGGLLDGPRSGYLLLLVGVPWRSPVFLPWSLLLLLRLLLALCFLTRLLMGLDIGYMAGVKSMKTFSEDVLNGNPMTGMQDSHAGQGCACSAVFTIARLCAQERSKVPCSPADIM